MPNLYVKLAKLVCTCLILLSFGAGLATTAVAAICKDGSYSSSAGRGTCSHHGGVFGNDSYSSNLADADQAYVSRGASSSDSEGLAYAIYGWIGFILFFVILPYRLWQGHKARRPLARPLPQNIASPLIQSEKPLTQSKKVSTSDDVRENDNPKRAVNKPPLAVGLASEDKDDTANMAKRLTESYRVATPQGRLPGFDRRAYDISRSKNLHRLFFYSQPLISSFVGAELDAKAPGERGLGRTDISRLGGTLRKVLQDDPLLEAQLKEGIELLLFSGFAYAACANGLLREPYVFQNRKLNEVWHHFIVGLNASRVKIANEFTKNNEAIDLINNFAWAGRNFMKGGETPKIARMTYFDDFEELPSFYFAAGSSLFFAHTNKFSLDGQNPGQIIVDENEHNHLIDGTLISASLD